MGAIVLVIHDHSLKLVSLSLAGHLEILVRDDGLRNLLLSDYANAMLLPLGVRAAELLLGQDGLILGRGLA